MVDGLDIGVGYTMLNFKALDSGERDQEEGTAYIKYASGPVSVGYQKGAVSVEGTAENLYGNEYIGLSYKISASISVSYNEAESRKTDLQARLTEVDAELADYIAIRDAE